MRIPTNRQNKNIDRPGRFSAQAIPVKIQNMSNQHQKEFVFNGLTCRDFSGAGVKFEIIDEDGEMVAVMLPADRLEEFINWLSSCIGLPHISFHHKTRDRLEEIIKSKKLRRADSNILKNIIAVLDIVYQRRAESGKTSPKAERALSRA